MQKALILALKDLKDSAESYFEYYAILRLIES